MRNFGLLVFFTKGEGQNKNKSESVKEPIVHVPTFKS